MVALDIAPPDGPPAHVAIIMDGNGRWARARGLPRAVGHRRGADAVRRVVEAAADLGIRYVTLYSFSSENWNRPSTEVDDLMQLLRRYLRSETAELIRNGVELRVIGERERLPEDIRRAIADAEAATASNRRVTVTMAISYGARGEIAAAARALARRAAKGELDPEAIDESLLADSLFTADLPDPDLLIRTSGEQRLSNFLLWQAAYAELVFTDTLWPDFSREDLERALHEFRKRERRYGAIGATG